MLLATRCGACDRPGPSPCAPCHATLRPPAPDVDPPGLPGLVALLRYDGAAATLVARIKYGNRRQAVGWLADGLAARLDGASVDLVTWAPTTVEHRRARGFDQGEVLARAVARRLGRPARGLLDRAPGPSQTGRGARTRREAPPAFSATRSLAGRRVLVVDDVVTTGATLAAAAAALGRAGARVQAACAARTPAAGGRGAA